MEYIIVVEAFSSLAFEYINRDNDLSLVSDVPDVEKNLCAKVKQRTKETFLVVCNFTRNKLQESAEACVCIIRCVLIIFFSATINT